MIISLGLILLKPTIDLVKIDIHTYSISEAMKTLQNSVVSENERRCNSNDVIFEIMLEEKMYLLYAIN